MADDANAGVELMEAPNAEGTIDGAPAGQDTPVASPSGTEDPAELKKARDAAVRRMHEATQETARLRKEMAQLQEDRLAKLEAVSLKLAEERTRPTEPAVPTDEEILAKLQGDDGARETLNLIRQGYSHVDRKYAEKLTKQEEENRLLRQKIEELTLVTTDPVVQANRVKIEQFSKKFNVPLMLAATMVKDLVPSQPAAGDVAPSGTGPTGRVAVGGNGKPTGLSAKDIEELEIMQGRKLTADEISYLSRPAAGRQ